MKRKYFNKEDVYQCLNFTEIFLYNIVTAIMRHPYAV